MCDHSRNNTRHPLSLELHAPRIRPEAFPWGSGNVEIHASFPLQNCRSIVTLPSVVDISALLLPGEEGREERLVAGSESLDVDILGYDNGISFELGSASIPLPTWTMLQQTVKSDHQFRVCLIGAAGMRTGMLTGTFQACSTTTVDHGASEAGGVQSLQPEDATAVAETEVREKTVDDAVGREIENDVSGQEQPSKVSPAARAHSAKNTFTAGRRVSGLSGRKSFCFVIG